MTGALAARGSAESNRLMPPIDGSENVVDALFNFGHGGFFARCQSAERKLRKEG